MLQSRFAGEYSWFLAESLEPALMASDCDHTSEMFLLGHFITDLSEQNVAQIQNVDTKL